MNHRNHQAVIELKKLGYPIINIRKSLHKLTGVTQLEIARRIGISRQGVTKYIEGRREKIEIKAQIAEIWGIPTEELFPEHHETA